jgi:hydroxyacylglutathione hydrolase
MPTIIPIPAFRDNYIWLLREGRAAVVVDPGDAAPVLEHLAREGLDLAAILVTHHHNDHVGGVARLVEHARVPVFGPARETIPCRTHALSEGTSVDVPGVGARLAVLDIPGHTAGHIAFVGQVGGDEVMFCGDTLFAAGCGRLFEGTPQQMWESLGKLARQAPSTLIYCGHEYTLANLSFAAAVEPGNADIARRTREAARKREAGEPTLPSRLADELLTNPVLRAARPDVRAAAQAESGETLEGPVETFAALRAWKNRF